MQVDANNLCASEEETQDLVTTEMPQTQYSQSMEIANQKSCPDWKSVETRGLEAAVKF